MRDSRGKEKPRYSGPLAEDMLYGPCRIHYAYLDGKRILNHQMKDCRTFLRLCRWISCRKNTGYHATDPKIRTQGAERVRSRIATKHGDRSLESSNALHTAERDAELYPGSGPSW
jgi:hypothetical protein